MPPRARVAILLTVILFACLLVVAGAWPRLDLIASGLFYRPGQGFYLADNGLLLALHELAYTGPRLLGLLFAVGAVAAFVGRRPVLSLDAKAWAFLLLTLVIGPGLIANVGLKDHWGRARPREVTQFGGALPFTPALEPHFERARSNGSFVAGDAAFGFFLPAFAFVMPRRRARAVFLAAIAAAAALSFARLAMGAHFLSDILFAAATMLATVSALHSLFYGRQAANSRWRLFFSRASEDL